MKPRWVGVFKKSNIFSNAKKHVKHDSLLCSYLVLRFSARLSSSLKTSSLLGLFKRIGGARFRFFSLKKKKKDIEIITSCCNFFNLQDSNATSNLC